MVSAALLVGLTRPLDSQISQLDETPYPALNQASRRRVACRPPRLVVDVEAVAPYLGDPLVRPLGLERRI